MSELTDLLEYTISELKSDTPFILNEDDTIEKAINHMNNSNTSSCLVTRDGKTLLGIVTERDILSKVTTGRNSQSESVSKIMTKDPQSLKSNESVIIALQMMTHGNFRHLPVVDMENNVKGVINVKDVMAFFANHLQDQN